MNNFREGLTITCALLVFFSGSASSEPSARHAEERAALQLLRASHLASTGRCAEAIEVAQSLPSRDAKTELMVGKCAVSGQDYGTAIAALDRAANLDPQLVGVNLYRGISLYHLEDYEAARGALANARTVDEETALLEFYRGLLLLREDRARESALAFERAAARGPDLVEPVASYYAALAWQSIDENEPLNSAVARVSEQDDDGPWANEAERLVELQATRHRGGQTGLQRWASIKAGVEYDSNVVFEGSSTTVARPGLPTVDFAVDGENDDWRGVWQAYLGAEVFEVDEWTGGVLVGYAGNAHDDLDLLDQHFVSLVTWLDNEIRPTTLARFQVSFGYGWFDDEPYRINLDLAAIGEERWGRWGTTRCQLGAKLNDYRYDKVSLGDSGTLFSSDLDQDGLDALVGCDHELTLATVRRIEPTVYGGYQFSNYFSEGSEWDHYANRVRLGLRLGLPFKLDVDVNATYTRRDFRRASHFAETARRGPDRNDDSIQTQVELSREFTDHIIVSARYEYTDNGSNTGVFDYERHVVGAYVELKFP